MCEKGTDRSKFFRGEIDKYTWVDVGSSYLVNEITAAFLWAQLEEAESIVERRYELWNRYHKALVPLESCGLFRRPIVPRECTPYNAHIYYILPNTPQGRDELMADLKSRDILAVFHYIPLNTALAGRACSPASPSLPVTADLSARLLRLPLFVGLEVEPVIEALNLSLEHLHG